MRDKLLDIPFFLPKNSNQHPNLHGVNWNSAYKKYTELEKLLKNLEANETDFFAKGYEKCTILSEFLEQ